MTADELSFVLLDINQLPSSLSDVCREEMTKWEALSSWENYKLTKAGIMKVYVIFRHF